MVAGMSHRPDVLKFRMLPGTGRARGLQGSARRFSGLNQRMTVFASRERTRVWGSRRRPAVHPRASSAC